MKLLVINLQNPGASRYMNPKTIGSWMWGRRRSNYPMFAVDEFGKLTELTGLDIEATLMQKQVIDMLGQLGGECA